MTENYNIWHTASIIRVQTSSAKAEIIAMSIGWY